MTYFPLPNTLDHKLHPLRQSINKTDWRTHSLPTLMNTFYHPTENSICMLYVLCISFLLLDFRLTHRLNVLSYVLGMYMRELERDSQLSTDGTKMTPYANCEV